MRLTKFHWITLLILTFVVCLISASVQAYDPDSTDAYVFPYDYDNATPMEREAFNKLSASERKKIFEVPNSLVKEMSTEGLIETCLNWPRFQAVGLMVNRQVDFNIIYSESNVLQELFQREDVGIKLLERYEATNPETYVLSMDEFNTIESLRQDGSIVRKGHERYKETDPETYALVKKWKKKLDLRRKNLSLVEVLLAQDTILFNLQEEGRYDLLNICLEKISVKKKYPQMYGMGGYCWVVIGRILQKEKFEPFIQKIQENENLRGYITGQNFSRYFYKDEVAYSNVLQEISLSVEQFLQSNSKGGQQK